MVRGTPKILFHDHSVSLIHLRPFKYADIQKHEKSTFNGYNAMRQHFGLSKLSEAVLGSNSCWNRIFRGSS